MKRFLPALFMSTGFFVSCSTNSNSTASTTTAPAVKKNNPAPTVSTANKSGIRSMQKFTRTAGVATGPVRIVIDKSDFELRVYDSKGLLAAYPVVFGLKPLEDKFMQGDRKTPEGNFKIVYTKQHQLWRKMFMLDYPTKESMSRFNNRKSNGQIPANASVGNGIGIHGVEKGNDYFIDRYYNWTNGCISLKNTHIDDLALYVKSGTAVYIQK
ncbi:murein L,D-transpeptidase [Lacibacter luteus]|uniref:Murein L,D-transpeptidase n=1 Tax=Lacibacter luteus TaxID=2508719 RepID=A0A4Q1CM12_9BACT|nr:L,D-transpeptidase [Lacibacter luteus]RXK62078.1 murein L,D-transpeptidase [Lacibacter luteus]